MKSYIGPIVGSNPCSGSKTHSAFNEHLEILMFQKIELWK